VPVITGAPALNIDLPAPDVTALTGVALEALRRAAYEAASTVSAQPRVGDANRTWRQRSRQVRDYVLARAKGICEACGEKAPFVRRDGTPYLEPHHTTRLADEGLDHPRYVGAICPTCHRRIHSGRDGKAWNKHLQDNLSTREPKEVSTPQTASLRS
jgi:5-methylcytosine-specific restriction enzyme A